MEWTELVGIFTTGVISPLVVQWIRVKEQKRKAAKRDSVAEEVKFSKITFDQTTFKLYVC